MKRLPSTLALSVLAMACTLSLRSIVSADALRVVVLGASPEHPTVARMREELRVLGFEVEVLAGGAGDLASIARSRAAAAAVRVEGPPPAVVLWVDPARSAGDVIAGAEIRIGDATPGPSDPGLLALRAVELLRGRLLRVPASASASVSASASAPPAPPAAAIPEAPSAAPAPRPPPRRGPVGLALAPALLLSPGGLPPVPNVRLGAEWNPVPRVGAEVMAFVPTAAASVKVAEGEVGVRVLDIGGGIRGAITDPGADLSVSLGLGLSAMALFFSGQGAPPFVGVSGSRWVASPYAEAGATYRVHPRVALRLDLVVSLVRPEPVVRIAGREVATFGQPAVLPSLGMEVRP